MFTIANFKEHLKHGIGKYGSGVTVHIKEESLTKIEIALYTATNVYLISASQEGRTYLGCIFSSRFSQIGENHLRGNDLADGPFSLETWNEILQDIISCELLEVPKHLKTL